ncbi:TPA: HD domain-containing protein [Candidatus Galligastranaerophilus gallistercoris]|nr:HD domain-containing protein [Candidatus Galligastranaerophilus gallistercoris]
MLSIDKSLQFEGLDNFLYVSSESVTNTILLVDDEINNLQLLKRALRGKYNILTASQGAEGLDVLKENIEKICLIISDHKMPVMEGTEFLEKANEIAPDVIKILLTGFSDIEILTDAVNKCNLFQYIMKPFDPNELINVVESGIEKYNLSSSRSLMMKDLRELFYKTIKSISATLDAKDAYTHGHSMRVTLYSLMLAKTLYPDDEEFLQNIEIAGLLHDVGKISIPQRIICKPGKLTDEEFQIMKSHPVCSEKLVDNIKQLGQIGTWVKAHHERWDGRGYPDGLKGEEIPLSARIVAIADTYDAMTSTRSYRKALEHMEAINEIERCKGSQFDPELAQKFIDMQDLILQAKENPEEFYAKYSVLQKKVAENIHNM